jgi:Ankyrin repeats (3 copies)
VIRSALLWPLKVGVIAAALWYFLRDPLPYPADWIVSIVAAILLHLAYAAFVTGLRRGGDLRLLQKAGEPPADGQRIALVGTVRVTGEPLRAPISGAPCAGYTYEIFHYVRSGQSDNSTGSQRKATDFSGLALAPCVLHTMQGDFPLLSYPFLSGFAEQSWRDDAGAAQRAGAYIEATAFEKTLPFVGELAALGDAMRDTSGSIRKDWRVSDGNDLAGRHLQEQCIPAGVHACAFGIWSEARRALVADPGHDSRALLLVAGDAGQASQLLSSGQRSSRHLAIGSFAVAAAAVGFILFAPWQAIRATPGGSLVIEKQTSRLKDALSDDNLPEIARAIRYLDPNLAFEEGARTPLMWTRSVEAAEILIAHGASVAAHDAGGYSVLMNAAERGSPELLRYLAQHGGDVNEHLKANAATSVLSLAKENNTPAAVAALIAAGARE